MDAIIEIDGPTWLKPEKALRLQSLRDIAAEIKAIGYDGSIRIDSINGAATVDILVSLGGREWVNEYPEPMRRCTIRCASLYVDGVEFFAQEASIPMDSAPAAEATGDVCHACGEIH